MSFLNSENTTVAIQVITGREAVNTTHEISEAAWRAAERIGR